MDARYTWFVCPSFKAFYGYRDRLYLCQLKKTKVHHLAFYIIYSYKDFFYKRCTIIS